ncbi:HNH endonuclease [Mycolicibacterium llatzerense]|uniref:HNH endonuclease n=1 Tax=Mycolicibacterium llatzerense TaxID=280871 RepID=UPI0008DE11A2|nr:HNH endonuclease signature motif containing protein [Mycolicibacterium llatzerense]
MVKELESQFKMAATRILETNDGPLGAEWTDLEQWRQHVRLDGDSVLTVTDPGVAWLRRYAAFASADGIITADELRAFHEAALRLKLSASPFLQQLGSSLQRAHTLGRIRSGDLPRVSVHWLHMPIDEHCYAAVPATRVRYLKAGPQSTPGQLVVTNRKVRFVAPTRGGELPLSKVLAVTAQATTAIALDTTSGSVSGTYLVGDAEWVAAVIGTTLQIDRRKLIPGAGRGARKPIPQHVKSEVWQRDHGACVECGAREYLEFDHVIPRSKGGADTVGNLQLLCRRCNALKSDRI